MSQVFHTWMNDKNTAETSKIVMEELGRVSFFAGTIMKSTVFSFTFSAYPRVSGENFGSQVMAEWLSNMSPGLDYASQNPSPIDF